MTNSLSLRNDVNLQKSLHKKSLENHVIVNYFNLFMIKNGTCLFSASLKMMICQNDQELVFIHFKEIEIESI